MEKRELSVEVGPKDQVPRRISRHRMKITVVGNNGTGTAQPQRKVGTSKRRRGTAARSRRGRR